MATYTVSFPEGKYPIDYDPGNPDLEAFADFNPMFGELVNMSEATLGDWTSTGVSFDLSNGLTLKLTGTGFDFDDDDVASDGKISKLELFYDGGNQRISSLTLSKLSLVDFMDTSEIYDPWTLQSWLLNRADRLNGSNGHDDLFGFGGNDVFAGKGGDDFMEGGEGKDRYDGGAGSGDMISFVDSHGNPDAIGGISIDFAKHKVTDQYGNLETFKNVEGVRGTQWRDTMKGSGGDEAFDGLGGRDIIDGKGGIDAVRYHRDDRFGGHNGVIVDLGAGTAVDGFGKTDKLSNIENVRGTAFDDEITGSNANNVLRGDDGNDVIAGGLGDDYILGGTGNDELEGGDGSDTFVFDTGLDDSDNVDVINDFVVTDDMFHLNLAVFAGLAGDGVIGADEFAANADGDATTVDQRILYSSDTGEVFYDADGSGAGDKILFAVIETGLNLTADNFYAG